MTPQGRPTTPQQSGSEGNAPEPDDFRPSVKDLANRFESSSSISSDITEETECSPQPSASSLGARHRSKSESDFRAMETKPKSVLSRQKKPKKHKPRKSVTFSDSVCLVASSDLFGPPVTPVGDQMNSGYVSDEEDRYRVGGGSYSDNDCDDNDSTDSPTEPVEPGQIACSLCGKKGVPFGQQYCDKCYMYMCQFQHKQ